MQNDTIVTAGELVSVVRAWKTKKIRYVEMQAARSMVKDEEDKGNPSRFATVEAMVEARPILQSSGVEIVSSSI